MATKIGKGSLKGMTQSPTSVSEWINAPLCQCETDIKHCALLI